MVVKGTWGGSLFPRRDLHLAVAQRGGEAGTVSLLSLSVGSAVQTYLFLLRVRRVRKEEVERSAGLQGGGGGGGRDSRQETEGERGTEEEEAKASGCRLFSPRSSQ